MKSSVIVRGQRSYLNITWRKSAVIQFFSNAWISKSAALESDLANNNTTIQRFIPMRKLPQFLLVTLYLVYKYTLNKEMFTFFNVYYSIHRALARKKKNSAFCMNWKKKNASLVLGVTMSSLVGSVGDQEAKLLENLQYLA